MFLVFSKIWFKHERRCPRRFITTMADACSCVEPPGLSIDGHLKLNGALDSYFCGQRTKKATGKLLIGAIRARVRHDDDDDHPRCAAAERRLQQF